MDIAGVLIAGQQHPGRPQADGAEGDGGKDGDGMETDPPAGMTAGGIGDVLPEGEVGGGAGLRIRRKDDPRKRNSSAAGIHQPCYPLDESVDALVQLLGQRCHVAVGVVGDQLRSAATGEGLV
ncbi:hypothetical protein D3C87_1191920 [compost metagenome]